LFKDSNKNKGEAMQGIKRILPLFAIFVALLSGGAKASLIGDTVTCSFTVVGAFNINNEICSTSASSYTPGPRVVGAYTEFYPGLLFTSPPPLFVTGAYVNIGADSIGLIPAQIVTGYLGSFFLNIGSLDWVGEPDRVITGVVATAQNLDLTTLSVSFTDHSVHIAIVDAIMQAGTQINVQLLSGIPAQVPLPAPLTLTVLGLGILLVHRRSTRMTQVALKA
jgi:hypothetical protein